MNKSTGFLVLITKWAFQVAESLNLRFYYQSFNFEKSKGYLTIFANFGHFWANFLTSEKCIIAKFEYYHFMFSSVKPMMFSNNLNLWACFTWK